MTDTNEHPERRRRSSDVDLQALVESTVRTTVEHLHTACLSEPEQQYVRMAIEREARRAKLQNAVIEKTFAGLVWAGVVGLGYLFIDFLKNHGLRL